MRQRSTNFWLKSLIILAHPLLFKYRIVQLLPGSLKLLYNNQSVISSTGSPIALKA